MGIGKKIISTFKGNKTKLAINCPKKPPKHTPNRKEVFKRYNYRFQKIPLAS